MDEKFNAILSIAIIPEVISLISKNENIDKIQAINEFYDSKVYSLLSDEETKMWHYSPFNYLSYVERRKNNWRNHLS